MRARHELSSRTHAQREFCGSVQTVDADLPGTAQRVRVKVSWRGKVCGFSEDVTSNLPWLTCAFVIQSVGLWLIGRMMGIHDEDNYGEKE
jgi:hypothetical protein